MTPILRDIQVALASSLATSASCQAGRLGFAFVLRDGCVVILTLDEVYSATCSRNLWGGHFLGAPAPLPATQGLGWHWAT